MKVSSMPSPGFAQIDLVQDDVLHVLHPSAIVAFQGAPRLREDKFMNLSGAYRKKRWIRARIQGESRFIFGLPAGYWLKMVDITADSNLLFDFHHIAMFTDGIAYRSKIMRLRTAWITRELVRIRFTGPGQIGVLTAGDLAIVQLQPDEPLFVDKRALIAYPEDADIRLAVYGNTLASQQMNVQWQLQGNGPVLLQTGARDTSLEDKLAGDNWFKRTLRELLPFGGIYIK